MSSSLEKAMGMCAVALLGAGAYAAGGASARFVGIEADLIRDFGSQYANGGYLLLAGMSAAGSALLGVFAYRQAQEAVHDVVQSGEARRTAAEPESIESVIMPGSQY